MEEFELFPATAPLGSVAIVVLRELTTAQRGNRYPLVITDRFPKLTRIVPVKGISDVEAAEHFGDEWVLNYGPAKDLLADNGACFTAKFFRSVCKTSNVYSPFTIYNPDTMGR